MRAYDLIDGGGSAINLNLYTFDISFDETNQTKLTIIAPDLGGDAQSYKVDYIYDFDISFINSLPPEDRPSFLFPEGTVSSNSNPIVVTGLTPGQRYKFSLTAYAGPNNTLDFGNSVIKQISMPKLVDPPVITNTGTTGAVNPKLESNDPIVDNSSNIGDSTDGTGSSSGSQSSSSSPQTGDTGSTVIDNDQEEAIDPTLPFKPTVSSIDLWTANSLGDNIPKSVMRLTAPVNYSSYNTKVAYKDFEGVTPILSESYYSFGTSIYFDDSIDNPNQKGGFGFFVAENGKDGYFVKIQTTASANNYLTDKEVSIFKVQNGQVVPLEDSQKTDVTKLVGIYGGKVYRLDAKVKYTPSQTDISVYVNGYKITATDKYVAPSGNTPPVPTLTPKNRVAGFAQEGQINYDYFYATNLDSIKYNDQSYLFNVYNGQYPSNLVKSIFDDNIFNAQTSAMVGKTIEEFGTTARELRKVKIRFNSRPSNPIYASTGINKLAEVVGSKFTNFGAEIYTINNSGMFVPLSDGGDIDFFVIGTSIAKTGEYEYTSTVLNDYTLEDPAVFQSTWIQSLQEAHNLEQWIKSKWAKKQMSVRLSVFGNPLISVGDIIYITHDYQGLDTTRKFLITNVDHSYSQGLETSIICRTL